MAESSNIISAFSADQVMRLTGLTMAQLAYWDRTGFFQPQYAADDRRSPYSRIYSFKDVVGLRTLAVLRGKHGVSLRHLREVARDLSKITKTPWADVTLYVWNRKVQFKEPVTGFVRGVVDRQYFLLPLASVIEDVRREADEMKVRDQASVGRIERHRYISHNSPVVAGTRVRVETILRYIEDGFSTEQILAEYPTLTKADVEAAIQHGKAGLAA